MVTFQLPTPAIDTLARGSSLGTAAIDAIAASQPVPGSPLHTIICSREVAREIMEWLRAAAALSRSDPAQSTRAGMCAHAMRVIAAALDQ